MVIAVIGSRGYKNRTLVEKYIKSLEPGTKVISGGASGPDFWAIKQAKACGLIWEEFLADWLNLTHPDAIIETRSDGTKYDKTAGFRRNIILAQQADKVVAFWDGVSKGTKSTIDLAKKFKKEIIIIKN